MDQTITVSSIGQTVLVSLNNGIFAIINFVPKFIAGLIILLIGIVIAAIVKRIVVEIFKVLRLDQFLQRYGVPESSRDLSWANILSEIVRWFVIVLFLIPTADVWGLPQIVTVLNEFLLYLPNVFVAAVIALVGLVAARLAHDVVLASLKGINRDTARTLASIVRWAITVFVFLAVLNQLGVAVELVRILFTGFVAMIAIAGGIAFGLGGQGVAKGMLEDLKKRLK